MYIHIRCVLNLHVTQVMLSILFYFMCEMAQEALNSNVTPIHE